MSQNEIICAVIKKCQHARKSWLANSTDEILKVEFEKWSLVSEGLAEIFADNLATFQNPE